MKIPYSLTTLKKNKKAYTFIPVSNTRKLFTTLDQINMLMEQKLIILKSSTFYCARMKSDKTKVERYFL